MTTAQINLQSAIASRAIQRGSLKFAENPLKFHKKQKNNSDKNKKRPIGRTFASLYHFKLTVKCFSIAPVGSARFKAVPDQEWGLADSVGEKRVRVGEVASFSGVNCK